MSKVWAFLISVAEYDDKEWKLDFVHGDNTHMMRGLVDGLSIPREHIAVCGNNCYVTYSDFQTIISKYSDVINSSDRVIAYFSGHGGGTPFSLKFSDMDVDFSVFCDELDALNASSKILIIDSCYSGNGEIPEVLIDNPSQNLFDYVRSGYAVFASSNAGSTSGPHPNKQASLYTYCFANALCNARIHKGKVSLIDVARCASIEVDHIAKTYGIRMQHPVFKCQIPGDVLFQITEEKEKNKCIYTAEHEHYDIHSTQILHSAIEMRYSVFAIVRGTIDDECIARYTAQIACEMHALRKFESHRQAIRFSGESVKVVFVYWGKSEDDVIRRNWIYRSVWADPTSNRDNWYHLDKHSKIVSDIWVRQVPNYNEANDFYRKNMISDEDLVTHTHAIADSLLKAAYEVVRYFEEYDNGEIPEFSFIQASTKPFKVIEDYFFRMSRLPIPSVELKEWSDEYDSLAGYIDDMRLFYTSPKFLDRDEMNRKVCMRGAIEGYRGSLQKLIRIEERLKGLGVLPNCSNEGEI